MAEEGETARPINLATWLSPRPGGYTHCVTAGTLPEGWKGCLKCSRSTLKCIFLRGVKLTTIESRLQREWGTFICTTDNQIISFADFDLNWEQIGMFFFTLWHSLDRLDSFISCFLFHFDFIISWTLLPPWTWTFDLSSTTTISIGLPKYFL